MNPMNNNNNNPLNRASNHTQLQYGNSNMNNIYDSGNNYPNQYSDDEDEEDQETVEFRYSHDFDENGTLFYLGTLGKTNNYQNPYNLS